MATYQHIPTELTGPQPDRRFAALGSAVLVSLAIHGGALLLIPGQDDMGVANFGHGGITVSLGPAGRDAGGEVAAAQSTSETLEEVRTTEAELLEAVTPAEPEALTEIAIPEPEPVVASEAIEMRATETAPTLPEPDLVLDAEVADVSDLSAPLVGVPEVEVIEVEMAEVAPAAPPSVEPEAVVATTELAPPPLPKRRPPLQKKPPVQETREAEAVTEPEKIVTAEAVTGLEPNEEARAEDTDGDSDTQTANQVAGEGGKSGDSGLSEAGQGDNTAGGGAPGTDSDYFHEVTAWLEKHKRYPRRSKLRSEEGVVMLRFVVNRDGTVTLSRIKESSGYKRLDKEAMGMIERAQPLPPIPDNMRQAKLVLVIPVKFHLR